MREQESKSTHILSTSSNLLGICFIVLTSLKKILNLSEKTVIDEITVVAIILFMVSCILSFLSIRGKNEKSKRYENIADYFFLGGISLLFVTTILYNFNIIQ